MGLRADKNLLQNCGALRIQVGEIRRASMRHSEGISPSTPGLSASSRIAVFAPKRHQRVSHTGRGSKLARNLHASGWRQGRVDVVSRLFGSLVVVSMARDASRQRACAFNTAGWCSDGEVGVLTLSRVARWLTPRFLQVDARTLRLVLIDSDNRSDLHHHHVI
jgi:hypothetical protein